MRPLELGLHAASLTCILALGAALWQVRRTPAAPPPAPAAQPDPAIGEGLRGAQAGLEALRNDLESQRLRLQALEAAQRAAAYAPAAPAPPSASAAKADLLAALDDPGVQEKLRTVARPDPGQMIQAFTGGKSMQDMMTARILDGLGLNDAQRQPLQALLKASQERVSGLFDKVDAKELTKDQAKEDLRRHRADVDGRARGLLTDEQFRKYQEGLKPLRGATDRMMDADPAAGSRAWSTGGTDAGPGAVAVGMDPKSLRKMLPAQ